MSTENRDQRKYHYHATREGDRIVKQYVGAVTDPFVAMFLRHKSARKADRAAHAAAMAQERTLLAEFDKGQSQLSEWAELIIEGWLGTQGHRIDRRTQEWRQMRRAPDKQEPVRGVSRDEFEALVAKAQSGDDDALIELKSVMNANIKCMAPLGDLGEHCKRLIATRVVGDNVYAQESLLLRASEIENSMGINDANPIERLLIQRVVVSWLDVNHAQFAFQQDRDSKTDQKYFESRLEKAQKRHVEAVECLNRFRS